ncbi:hypothetical protein [Salinarchaeum laminariae]|uniref:hypothetical protein n=1 Tax=Salinarchaeum laminariae TaxID=869888 RepID=UPI0020BF2C74|nr:hypothetical protein [Salinarchaeum laminariae]
MSTGLARYGIEAPTVVRAPVTDPQDRTICPECGHPVGGTRGTQRIARPTVLDEDLTDADELLTHGYHCKGHPSWVVLPSHPDSVPDGWLSVEIELSDGRAREIPVAEPEVSASA